jgi:hypothetical protein
MFLILEAQNSIDPYLYRLLDIHRGIAGDALERLNAVAPVVNEL